VHKLVTKVITNRQKEPALLIISNNESKFTLRQLIINNILVVFYIFHDMICHSGVNGSMTIKLDISNAYDKVDWIFSRRVVLKIGFHDD